MIRFPRSLHVLGYDVPVRWVDIPEGSDGDWAWGECVGWDKGQMEIHLNPRLRNEPEWFQRQVLAHETMHALLAVTGLGEAVGDAAEEQICKHAELLAEVFWAPRTGRGKGKAGAGRPAPKSKSRARRRSRGANRR